MEAPFNLDPDLKELISSTHEVIYVVNGYRSKGKLELDLGHEGETTVWHSMKGGPPGKSAGSFEIFYNPDKNEWLKVGYQGRDGNNKRMRQLQNSVPFTKTALELANLPHIASALKESTLEIRELPAFAYTLPHIGITLEQIYKWLKQSPKVEKPTTLTPITERLFIQAYQVAYNQAQKLYVDHGFWVVDPNAGNIVLAQATDGVQVAIIDVVSDQQRQNNFSHLQEPARSQALTGPLGGLKHAFETKLAELVGHKVKLTNESLSQK